MWAPEASVGFLVFLTTSLRLSETHTAVPSEVNPRRSARRNLCGGRGEILVPTRPLEYSAWFLTPLCTDKGERAYYAFALSEFASARLRGRPY
jgi:hypothetical protein